MSGGWAEHGIACLTDLCQDLGAERCPGNVEQVLPARCSARIAVCKVEAKTNGEKEVLGTARRGQLQWQEQVAQQGAVVLNRKAMTAVQVQPAALT